MNDFFQTLAIWSMIYLFVVLGRVPIKEILKLIGSLANSIKGNSDTVAGAVKSGNNRIFKALKQLFDIVLTVLGSAIDTLDKAIINVTKQFTTKSENLPSRILGAVISFILLITFIYADAALAFQAIETLFPGIDIPEIFLNISVALVASSVATIAALGIMFWDTVGFTDLTPLGEMKGFAKGVFIGVVAITSLFTLICVLLIALNRAPLLAEFVEQAGFSILVRAEIHRWASLAHSFVIVPMLVTTFMMFRGIFGFFVLYMLVVGVMVLVLRAIRLLFQVLRVVMVPGVNDTLSSGFLFAISEMVLIGLGWIVGTALACVAALTQVLQLLLDVITVPSIQIWDFIVPSIKMLLSRSQQPHNNNTKKPSEEPIPEVLERLSSNGKEKL
ncbi:MAG: hypothetical protein KF758_04745 [Anaerolineales bacterium]|nr:hypothetical protein [Anaerolineales bacterium]